MSECFQGVTNSPSSTTPLASWNESTDHHARSLLPLHGLHWNWFIFEHTLVYFCCNRLHSPSRIFPICLSLLLSPFLVLCSTSSQFRFFPLSFPRFFHVRIVYLPCPTCLTPSLSVSALVSVSVYLAQNFQYSPSFFPVLARPHVYIMLR